MIHKFLATLSFFMLRFSDGICFGYLFIKLRGPVQHFGRWKNRGFGTSAPPIRHTLSHPSAVINRETTYLYILPRNCNLNLWSALHRKQMSSDPAHIQTESTTGLASCPTGAAAVSSEIQWPKREASLSPTTNTQVCKTLL